MTAINAYLTPSRGYLLTDGAVYTRQGLIVGFGQKAVAMPTLKAALAVRGMQKTVGLLAMEMSVTFSSMDELLAVGEQYLRQVVPQLLHGLTDGLDAAQFLVVGWSDTRAQPVGIYYDTTSDEFGEVDEWIMGPMLDDEQEEICKRQKCSLDVNLRPRDFDPIAHGVPLMEAQRRMKIMPVGCELDEPISIVGGTCLVTEVSRTGVKQFVAHRWPDVIGENIEPERVATPTATLAQPKLSRQARRALERAR